MIRLYTTALLVAHLLFIPDGAEAQIDEIGSVQTLEVATWNIEWFGEDNNGPVNEDLQLENVITIIEDSGIDLWALQEIADEQQFDALRTALGDEWASVIAEISSGQATAFLYDTRTVSLRTSTQILTNFGYEFAGRPPLKAEFGISLPDTSFVVTIVNVHMKAFADVESWERRLEASARVKSHLDFLHPNEPVIFLGDFNDELEGSTLSGRDSPYKNFVDDTDDYYPATLELERDGVFSFCDSGLCSVGSSIDHIIVSDELLPLLAFSMTNRLSSALSINSYTRNTSDHLPMYAVFRDYIDTAVREVADVPRDHALTGVYPNPFISEFSATVEAAGPTDLRIDLVDALGRVVLSHETAVDSPGGHEIVLDPGSIPAGAYFLRITSSGSLPAATVTRPVLKAGRR